MKDIYQEEVIKENSNIIVIAGPGSGKTTTILNKTLYLINQGFKNDILILSFTNKSVLDIKERLNNNDVTVFTFHSLAIDILKYNKINFHICSIELLDYIIDEYIKRLDTKQKKKLAIYLGVSKLSLKSYEYQSFKRLIKTFINLYKTNNKTINDLRNISKEDMYLMKIILDIFLEYEEEKKSTITLDFDDLIKEATTLLKNNYNYRKFKYIIIDEFQDTSMIRLNLVKIIYENSNSIITCVGDDAQSIFHFSGCDLNIFLNFQKYFPKTKMITLKHTYRNSQSLINISESFINKNKLQIKKGMISKVPDNKPIEIKYYLNSKNILIKVLDEINNPDILIISRNISDINEYLSNDITYDGDIIYKNNHYKYMTIHSSKGLEANYVIILNCSNKKLGLPNKIEDHRILKSLNKNDDTYPYAEERRVFFVAITRCKIKTILLVPYDNPSPFIKEIKKDVTRTSLKQL